MMNEVFLTREQLLYIIASSSDPKHRLIADILRLLIIYRILSINDIINRVNTFKIALNEEPVLREKIIEAVNFLISRGFIKIESMGGTDWARRVIGESMVSIQLTKQMIMFLQDKRYHTIAEELGKRV